MNLTDAADIKINGKEVQQIKIDGNIVYPAGYRIRITTDKTYILTGETATLTVKCEDLPFTQIELYNVIDMVQTKIADLTTDSNGQATYTYTGDGSGEIGFLAKYDEKESNMVIIDDYIPVYHPVLSNWPTTITYGHANSGLVVTAKDQHDEKANGVTVVFKEGDTVLDTIVTGGSTPETMGTATLDLNSLGVGVHTIYAVIGSTSSTHTATITVNKANTSLAISVPALVYSDNFSVTGVLKDSYNTPISGATVRLKWNVGNNEYSATARTNDSGGVTFATQAPTSITDYTFQLEFDGNANYNSSTSSVVEKTVGKETTILNLTTPSTSSVTCDGTLSIAGTLLTDDGELVDDVNVWLSENGYNSQYFYVEDGEFSGTITGLSAGTHTLRFEFYGSDSTLYNGSYKEITVNVVQYDGMSLSKTAGSNILSYADEQKTPGSQTCTVTAQLKNGSAAASVSGVPIVFGVYKNDVLVGTTSSVNTDSNGQASYTYTSQGIGDIVVKAVPDNRVSVSKTFVIQDCWRYDDASSDKTSSYGSIISYRGGSGTWNYNSTNGYYGTLSGNNEVMVDLIELTGQDDFTIEFDALFNSNSVNIGIGAICAYENNNNYSRLSCHGKKIAQRVSVNGSASESESDVSSTVSKGDLLHFKFTISNNQIIEEVTRGNTGIGTRTISYTPTNATKYGLAFVWDNAWTKDTFLKNIKIKPL